MGYQRTPAVVGAGGGGVSGIADVPGLEAALALLQEEATAATDDDLADAIAVVEAELAAGDDADAAALAAAVGTINTSLAGKQDAASAATDAELAAAQATLNTAIGTKVPSSLLGAANGVATLDSDSKVPAVQLPAESASDVTVSTSGLVVVTHTNVQAALADLDAYAAARPSHEHGTLAGRPSAASRNADSTYYTTDEGITYRQVAGAWVASMPGSWELDWSSKSNGTFSPLTTDLRKDVTDLDPITFDVTTGMVAYVEYLMLLATAGTAGAYGAAYLCDETTADGVATGNVTGLKRVGHTVMCYQAVASTRIGEIFLRERIATPGTYTRKVQLQSITGAVSFAGSTTQPQTLRAYALRA